METIDLRRVTEIHFHRSMLQLCVNRGTVRPRASSCCVKASSWSVSACSLDTGRPNAQTRSCTSLAEAARYTSSNAHAVQRSMLVSIAKRLLWQMHLDISAEMLCYFANTCW